MNFVDLNHMAALRLKGRMINNKESEEYLALNENIIKIAGLEGGPTATLGEKLNIIDYYLTKKEYETAGKKLKSWISYANTRKSDYSLMLLHTKQANLVIAEKRFDTLDVIYNSVFRKIQRDSLQHIQIEVLNHKDCKPYGNRSIVKMFLDATKNYSKAYGATSKEAYLDKAHNLSTLASGVFSENFSYLPFNEGTYKTATQINEQLLNTAVLLKDNVAIDKVLQSIEQNGSKLSWKKFLASSQRENLNIPDSIIEKESELKSELQFYKKALFADTDINKEKANRFKEKIHNVETEIEQLEKWYSNNYPSYFNQTQKAFDIQLLKQKLKPNQSVIKYVFAEDNVYAFAVSKDATNLIKLASRKELVRKLKPFVLALNKTNSQDFQDLAKEIYSLLLPQSLLIADKKQQLIFIQDDVLNYVPMEVLVDANGKYLIQSHAVSYAASLLLWNEQLQVKKSRRNKMGVFVPSYKNQKNDNPKRDDDTELLGANTEANAIGKLFRSDVFSGPEVSKAQFLNTAKNYNILHLAMHSAINDTDAEFSNLRFSSDKDSKLFISELYNMNLNADLAVLSACNTGQAV